MQKIALCFKQKKKFLEREFRVAGLYLLGLILCLQKHNLLKMILMGYAFGGNIHASGLDKKKSLNYVHRKVNELGNFPLGQM